MFSLGFIINDIVNKPVSAAPAIAIAFNLVEGLDFCLAIWLFFAL